MAATLRLDSIESTIGTSGIELSTTGAVRLPNRPTFYAYGTSTLTTTVVGGIVFLLTRVNSGNCYNVTNGRFTAPIAGNYLFFGQALHNPSTSSPIEVSFFKNGTNINSRGMAYSVNSSTTGHTPVMTSVILPLITGDYVQFGTSVISASSDIYLASNLSHFSGYLIG